MYDNPAESHAIETYINNGGYQTLKLVINDLNPEKVLHEVNESNIRGRGGPAFTTGTK